MNTLETPLTLSTINLIELYNMEERFVRNCCLYDIFLRSKYIDLVNAFGWSRDDVYFWRKISMKDIYRSLPNRIIINLTIKNLWNDLLP